MSRMYNEWFYRKYRIWVISSCNDVDLRWREKISVKNTSVDYGEMIPRVFSHATFMK